MKRPERPIERRKRILGAAARVFAEAGYRGATTRRIAAAAGVHEVTLFRHFGSKAELIREAIAFHTASGDPAALPHEPVDPAAELAEFGRRQLEHLFRVRSMIRTCMGESDERPEILGRAMERPVLLHGELLSYMRRMRDRGMASKDADLEGAATMLMGALFSDAMGRDFMPHAYPGSIDEAPARYVTLVLGSIGSGARGRP